MFARRGRPPKGTTVPSYELPELVELWRRAAATPRGIVVESQRPNALLQRLYAARRLTGGFTDLHIVEDKAKGCVWIVKRND